MRLQRSLGIEADGIVGDMTRRRIGGGGDGEVELLDWWLGGNVAVARLNEATVVDVRTGRSFQISRYGGDSHCDAEPMHSRDTAGNAGHLRRRMDVGQAAHLAGGQRPGHRWPP